MAVLPLHGRNGMVYLGTSGVALLIASAKVWKLTVDRDMDNVNVFGDTWQKQLAGLAKWSGSMEGVLDTSDTKMFDAAVLQFAPNAITNETPSSIYLYPASGSVSRYYYGTVWPKIDISVQNTNTITYTMDFEGDGTLAYN